MPFYQFFRQKNSTYESTPVAGLTFKSKTDAKTEARKLSKKYNCRIKYQCSPSSKHYVHYSDSLNSKELWKKFKDTPVKQYVFND